MSAIKALRYKVNQYSVRLVKERGAKVVQAQAFNTPRDIAEWLEPLRHYAEERFVAVCLNARNEPIGVIEVSHGTASSSLAHPREVFKGAILANSHAVVVAHNHPSDSAYASAEDLATTRQLIAAGTLLGVPVIDHLIMTSSGHVSIREEHPRLWAA